MQTPGGFLLTVSSHADFVSVEHARHDVDPADIVSANVDTGDRGLDRKVFGQPTSKVSIGRPPTLQSADL